MFSLILLSALLLSIPFLVPGTGFLSLVAFVPLLFAENIAFTTGKKHFWILHYLCFLLWNFATTFWVCNATIGGGIFASFANAFQMSLVFGVFRWSRKHYKGVIPYIFLAFAWMAWEFYYLHLAQISWPWLVLGNSFARTTSWVQWYEYLGATGGSFWILSTNLALYGLLYVLLSGNWKSFNIKAKTAIVTGVTLLVLLPPTLSLFLRPATQEETVDVVIGQPNFDPYHKFESLSQAEQNAVLLDLFNQVPKDSAVLFIAPETFTGDIVTNDYSRSATMNLFKDFISQRPGSGFLFGSSTYDYINSSSRPSQTARELGDNLWLETHNSALMLDSRGDSEIFHKSKLVVGVEMTPYPSVFRPLDDKLGGVMGRNIGQSEVTNLNYRQCDTAGNVLSSIPVASAICYESIYGEYCTEYVKKGAAFLTVITNDSWWKNTPGYRQHLSYASLRAIETRRWIARSANTGISAIIAPDGSIVKKTSWWEKDVLKGKVGLSQKMTFYVLHGDIVGRVSVLMFLLMFCGAIVRRFTAR